MGVVVSGSKFLGGCDSSDAGLVKMHPTLDHGGPSVYDFNAMLVKSQSHPNFPKLRIFTKRK